MLCTASGAHVSTISMSLKFIKIRYVPKNMRNKGIIADEVALPFWIVLIIYAIYQILHGNSTAWIIIAIIGVALIVDTSLVVEYLKKKRK